MNTQPCHPLRSACVLSSRPGFTLTEMLVVIGIIAVLAALLIPTAAGVMSRARDTAMGLEINKIQTAIEAYKLENGDYPPSFGGTAIDTTGGVRAVLMRHVRKCYPRISLIHLNQFLDAVEPQTSGASRTADIDQSEALVFWLSRTVKNPVLPFAGLASSDPNAEPRVYYDFDARRLEDPDDDGLPSFKPQYARSTYYMYIDSRMYFYHMNFPVPGMNDPAKSAAWFESSPGVNVEVVRPYFSDTFDTNNFFGFKFVNPNTYQILCAGQDGDWGPLLTPVPDTSSPPMTGVHQRAGASGIKRFPSGRDGRGNTASDDPAVFPDGGAGGKFIMVEEDQDNLANFSEGRTLKANLP